MVMHVNVDMQPGDVLANNPTPESYASSSYSQYSYVYHREYGKPTSMAGINGEIIVWH
jgi:hypothetical protein